MATFELIKGPCWSFLASKSL